MSKNTEKLQAKQQRLLYDPTVQDIDILLAGLADGVVATPLTPGSDVMASLRDTLADSELRFLHILGHGAPGEVFLSGERIDADRWRKEAETPIPRINPIQINFWSCRTGEGELGMSFINTVAQTSNAFVNAASGYVGHESKEGSWELDVSAKAVVPFSRFALASFYQVLDEAPTITSVNNAPTLVTANSPVLTTVLEDAVAPTGPVGNLVSDLVTSAGMQDTDAASTTLGIAITATNETNGDLYYSTNDGTSWAPVPAVTAGNVFLLAGDANTRLYFKPDADFAGTVSNVVTIKAWDQTVGTVGATTVSATTVSTALSSASDTVSISVTGTQDAPRITTEFIPAATATGYGSGPGFYSSLDVNATDADGTTPSFQIKALQGQSTSSLSTVPGDGTHPASAVFNFGGMNSILQPGATISVKLSSTYSISIVAGNANDASSIANALNAVAAGYSFGASSSTSGGALDRILVTANNNGAVTGWNPQFGVSKVLDLPLKVPGQEIVGTQVVGGDSTHAPAVRIDVSTISSNGTYDFVIGRNDNTIPRKVSIALDATPTPAEVVNAINDAFANFAGNKPVASLFDANSIKVEWEQTGAQSITAKLSETHPVGISTTGTTHSVNAADLADALHYLSMDPLPGGVPIVGARIYASDALVTTTKDLFLPSGVNVSVVTSPGAPADGTSINEGSSVQITISTTDVLTSDLVIPWQVVPAQSTNSNGFASANDFTSPTSGTVTLNASNTSAVVTIQTNNDSLPELREGFSVVVETSTFAPATVKTFTIDQSDIYVLNDTPANTLDLPGDFLTSDSTPQVTVNFPSSWGSRLDLINTVNPAIERFVMFARNGGADLGTTVLTDLDVDNGFATLNINNSTSQGSLDCQVGIRHELKVGGSWTDAGDQVALPVNLMMSFDFTNPQTLLDRELDLQTASDSGSAATLTATLTTHTDNTTNVDTPTFDINLQGVVTGDRVQLIEVLSDQTTRVLGEVTANTPVTDSSLRQLTVDGSHSLATGAHNIYAQVVDTAGNIGVKSSTITVNIDKTAPVTPSLDLIAASDSGYSNTDNVTNVSQPTLTVKWSSSAAASTLPVANDIVTIQELQSGNWVNVSSIQLTAANVTNGYVSWTPGSSLSSAAHQYRASITDVAGNVSPYADDLIITVDTTAPSIAGQTLSFGYLDENSLGVSTTDSLVTDTVFKVQIGLPETPGAAQFYQRVYGDTSQAVADATTIANQSVGSNNTPATVATTVPNQSTGSDYTQGVVVANPVPAANASSAGAHTNSAVSVIQTTANVPVGTDTSQGVTALNSTSFTLSGSYGVGDRIVVSLVSPNGSHTLSYTVTQTDLTSDPSSDGFAITSNEILANIAQNVATTISNAGFVGAAPSAAGSTVSLLPGSGVSLTAQAFNNPGVKQVETFTLSDTFDIGDVVTAQVNGFSATYTVTSADLTSNGDGTGGAASAAVASANVAAKLSQAILLAAGTVVDVTHAGSTITVTSDAPGQSFTLTNVGTTNYAGVKQVSTIALSNVYEVGDVVTATVNSTPVTYNVVAADLTANGISGAAGSTAQVLNNVAAKLAAAINTAAGTVVDATAANGVVTLTADTAGVTFTLSNVGATNYPGVKQESTLKLNGSYDVGDEVTATVGGTAVSYTVVAADLTANGTSGAAGTPAQVLSNVAAKLSTAINGNATAAALVDASVSGDTITLRADSVGTSVTVTSSNTNFAGVAQQSTLTLSGTYEAGDSVTATVNGTNVKYTVVAADLTANGASDDAGVRANVAAKLAIAINANAVAGAVVDATAANGVVTLTADTAGTSFSLSSSAANKYTDTLIGTETDGILDVTIANSGTYNYVAKVGDQAGNYSAESNVISVTVDRDPPQSLSGITPDLQVGSDSVGTGPNNDDKTSVTTPTFTVDATGAQVGDRVQLLDGTTVVATYTVTGTEGAGLATLSLTPTSALSSDTTHNITARVVDPAGNVGTATSVLPVLVDNTAPVTPNSLTVSSADDSGVSNSDAISNVSQPSIRVGWTAASNATDPVTGDRVTLYKVTGATGSEVYTSIGTANVTTGTNYVDIVPTTAFTTTGDYRLVAKIMDVAGKVSGYSTSLTYSFDNSSPQSLSGITPDLQVGSDSVGTGPNNDDKTSVTTPTFTVDATGAQVGDRVQLLDGTTVVATYTVTGTEGAGLATLSLTPTSALSSDTTHNITARVVDPAGNLGVATSVLPVLVDNTAPVTPNSLTVSSADDSGVSNSDAISNVSQPSIRVGWTAASNATDPVTGDRVTLYKVTGATGSEVYTSIGTANVTTGTNYVDIVPTTAFTTTGDYRLVAKIMDVAGKVSGYSTSLTYSFDNSSPQSLSGITPDLQVGSDSVGTGPNNDDKTSVTTPTFTVDATGAQVGDRVQLLDGTTVVATYTVTGTEGAGLATLSLTPTSALSSDTTHNITARVVDPAGNLGVATSVLPVLVDNTAPVTPTITLATDTGTSSSDAYTSSTTSNINIAWTATSAITAPVAGDRVELLENLSGTWTVVSSKNLTPQDITASSVSLPSTNSVLSDGTHPFKARIIDVTGNFSESTPLTVTVDTLSPTAPTLTFGNLTDSALGVSSSDGLVEDTVFDVRVNSVPTNGDAKFYSRVFGADTQIVSHSVSPVVTSLAPGAPNTPPTVSLSVVAPVSAGATNTQTATNTTSVAAAAVGANGNGAITSSTTTVSSATAKQVSSITLNVNDIFDSGDVVTATVNGSTYSYTVLAADITAGNASASRQAVAAKVAALIDANTAVGATAANGVITVTADAVNTPFTLTNVGTTNYAGVKQVSTIALSNVYEVGDVVTATVNSTPVTYNVVAADLTANGISGAAGSTAQVLNNVAAKLAAAINTAAGTVVDATAANGVVTLTADTAGVTFTLSNVGATNYPGVKQESTLKLNGSYDVGDEVTATVGGTAVSYTVVAADLTANGTSGAAGTPAQVLSNVAAKLSTAINGNATAAALVDASVSGDTITLRADSVGTSVTVTSSNTNFAGVAQQSTLTLSGTYEAGDSVTATVNGTNVKYTVVAADLTANGASDDAGVRANVAAKLAIAINANAVAGAVVDATAANGVVTLTADTAGTSFSLSSSAANKYTDTLIGTETDGILDVTIANSGTYNYVAKVGDQAGNYSAESNVISVTVDRDPPQSLSGITPDLQVGSDSVGTGPNNDDKTSVTTPTFTVDATGAQVGDRVQLLDGTTVVATYTVTGTEGAGLATLSLTPTSALSSDTTHNITARVVDPAGNLGVATSALPVLVDNTAPVAPATLTLATASDSGTSNTDNLSNVASPSVRVGWTTTTGNTAPKQGDLVELLQETAPGTYVQVGTASVGATNAYVDITPSTALSSNGNYVLKARITDVTGKVSAVSTASLTYSFDNIAPSKANVISIETDSSYVDDRLTSDNNAGTVFRVDTGEAGSVIKVFDSSDNDVTSSKFNVAAGQTSGTYTLTVKTGQSLADGVYTVKATDPAGNTKTGQTFSIDSGLPDAPTWSASNGQFKLVLPADADLTTVKLFTGNGTPPVDVTSNFNISQIGVANEVTISPKAGFVLQTVSALKATVDDFAGNTSAYSSTLTDPNFDDVTQLTGQTLASSFSPATGPNGMDSLDLSSLTTSVIVNTTPILGSGRIFIGGTPSQSATFSGYERIATGSGDDDIAGNDAVSEVFAPGRGNDRVDGGQSIGTVDYIDYRTHVNSQTSMIVGSVTAPTSGSNLYTRTITVGAAAADTALLGRYELALGNTAISTSVTSVTTVAMLVASLAAQITSAAAAPSSGIAGMNVAISGNTITLTVNSSSAASALPALQSVYAINGVDIDLTPKIIVAEDGPTSYAYSSDGGVDSLYNIDGILGTAYNDILRGDSSDNVIFGATGDDIISGGEGNDLLLGGSGNDVIQGGVGNDRIIGGLGNDALYGGQGKDVFVIGRGTGLDTIRDFEIANILTGMTSRSASAVDRVDFAFTTTQLREALGLAVGATLPTVSYEIRLSSPIVSSVTSGGASTTMELWVKSATGGEAKVTEVAMNWATSPFAGLPTVDPLTGNSVVYSLKGVVLADPVTGINAPDLYNNLLGTEENPHQLFATVQYERSGQIIDTLSSEAVVGGITGDIFVMNGGNDILVGGRGSDRYEARIHENSLWTQTEVAGINDVIHRGTSIINEMGSRTSVDKDVLFVEGIRDMGDLSFARTTIATEAGRSLEVGYKQYRGLDDPATAQVETSHGSAHADGAIDIFNQFSLTQSQYRVEKVAFGAEVENPLAAAVQTYFLGAASSVSTTGTQVSCSGAGVVGTTNTSIAAGDVITAQADQDSILVGSADKHDEFIINAPTSLSNSAAPAPSTSRIVDSQDVWIYGMRDANSLDADDVVINMGAGSTRTSYNTLPAGTVASITDADTTTSGIQLFTETLANGSTVKRAEVKFNGSDADATNDLTLNIFFADAGNVDSTTLLNRIKWEN